MKGKDEMANTKRAAEWVAKILSTGSDPAAYKRGIAENTGCTVAEVEAMIANGGKLRTVDAETVAQERLAEDRAYARQHPAAWRASQHEEC